MANALLIWDNNKSYVENTLSLELGISYPDDCVFSFEELKKNKFVSAKDAVIVLLDTDLDGKKRQTYYGLEIVKYLRKELRYKGLVVIYSTLTEQQIREQVEKGEILFTSGIRLRQITKKGIDTDGIEELIQSVPKLSDELLEDIHYNVFDTKGKIHELLHNLKNKLNDIKGKKNLKDFIKESNTVFEEYKKLLLKEIDPFKITEFEKLNASLVEETIEDITKHWNNEKDKSSFSYANAGNQVNKFSNQIVELAPVSNDDANTQKAENINWQVLFFDDTEGVRKKVKAFFEEKNVTCHVAATEEEVYQKLKENSPNISLFISDIRLLDKNRHWSDRQGYDVIEEVNKHNDYPLVYAVLTSKKGTINKMVQKKRKYEILWFTKDDVINNIHSFNIFFDLIKDYADENFNSNTVFQPLKKDNSWYKEYKDHYTLPLRAFYKLHKENNDYPTEESIINKKTLEWLEGEGVKQDWMCKFTKAYIGNAELKKFRATKLLGRRIALALATENTGIKPVTVYNDMMGHSRTDVDSSVKQFYKKLALSSQLEKTINDVKNYFKGEASSPGVLYEEYEFLKNEFIEELFIDSINLGYEKEGLTDFVGQIQKAFTSNRISEPKSFEKVKSILDNNGFPRAERLDIMLAELKELNEQSSYKLLKDVGKHSFLSSVNNEVIKELLKKYELI
jgi:CheY-like chemotaxis protein